MKSERLHVFIIIFHYHTTIKIHFNNKTTRILCTKYYFIKKPPDFYRWLINVNL